MGKAYSGLTEQVDFNDPLSVLLAREGEESDDMHEYWLAGTHKCATSEVERVYNEREPNVDKYTNDEEWDRRLAH